MRFLIHSKDTFCMYLSSKHTFTFLKYLRRLLVLIFGLFLCSVLNMLLIGWFVDLQLQSNWLPDLHTMPLLLRLFTDAIGVLLMGIGTAFYITPRLGAGPRDGLMMRMHILTRLRIAFVRAALECSALSLGFFL